MIERLGIVGVMGSGSAPSTDLSQQLGTALARRGVHLLTGGGGGVMAAVSEAFCSVAERRGRVLGILPCVDGEHPITPKPGYPNPWVEIPIFTHLPLSGTAGTDPMSRNHINVLTADAIVGLPGGQGTVSELRLALRYARPVIVFGAFDGVPDGIDIADDIAVVDAFLDRHLD